MLHSHDYREPTPFEGQRVCVVGIGELGVRHRGRPQPHRRARHRFHPQQRLD
ncbi:MAG: hypothetical protein U5R48_12320 [Gammaproteobacteria bacterium]|nr:hypothetical protein [Gammaproteobacteria bacterium]